MLDNLDSLISEFAENPRPKRPKADALVKLVNTVKFDMGSIIDTPAKQLINRLQFLSGALKGGSIDLTRYLEEIQEDAVKINLFYIELKKTITILIESNVKVGTEIAKRHGRLAEYEEALEDLKRPFKI